MLVGDCNSKWGSVRKVRYYEDIEAAIEYASKNSGSGFSQDVFISHIIESRQERHNIIQKHYRKGISKTKKSLYSTKFRITLPDTLVFLKEIGIFTKKNGKVMPLKLTKAFTKMSSEKEKRQLILKYVLNSKYKAYLCFLRLLNQIGQFTVPKHFKRDKQFREFLERKHFFTDVASFYTIRDLLYEMDAINWFVDEKNQLSIYPTISFGDYNPHYWTEQIEITNFKLNIRKKIDQDSFVENLVEIYLTLTNRRFSRNADLLQIRDIMCSKLRIGDFYFKELLLKHHRNKEIPYEISLNFGTIRERKRNYDLKLISLPRVTSNRLALYITINERIKQ